MRVKMDNVERVVSDEYGRELVARKKAVEVSEKASEHNSLENLKVDELKALAAKKGIEGAETMKKNELLDILKDVV